MIILFRTICSVGTSHRIVDENGRSLRECLVCTSKNTLVYVWRMTYAKKPDVIPIYSNYSGKMFTTRQTWNYEIKIMNLFTIWKRLKPNVWKAQGMHGDYWRERLPMYTHMAASSGLNTVVTRLRAQRLSTTASSANIQHVPNKPNQHRHQPS